MKDRINAVTYPIHIVSKDASSNDIEEAKIDGDYIAKKKPLKENPETAKEKDFKDDVSEEDLKLLREMEDKKEEEVINPDDENKFYSIVSDATNGLEEKKEIYNEM